MFKYLILAITLFHSAAAFAAESREQAIRRIEQYLSGITTMTADFTQTAPDGSLSEGRFYLQRPGKMRWEYKPPTPILIVSSGTQLVFYDRELEQVSYIPIADSLIGFLARDPIRLSGPVTILTYDTSPGSIRLTLTETAKPEEGKLTLEFSDAPLLLRNLIVTDTTGQVTNISLSGAEFGKKLDKELFIFRDPRKATPR